MEERVIELEIGSLLAGYQIDALISRGGMGSVYRATNVALHRVYAVKVLPVVLAEDSSFRDRFRREMRVAASLDHPNIVTVHNAGEQDGVLFLIMDYIDGADLRAVLRHSGAMPADHATVLLTQIASALDAAHARGLVHRDVKPANVLVSVRDGDERAYLTDFGLARRLGSGSSIEALTKTGTVVGTVDYMSPEQVSGERIDARTDIYALGCVFFEMLTGEVPYPRENSLATMYAHVHDRPPPLDGRAGDFPPELGAVVAQAIAKDPDERYLSAGDLARAAGAALHGVRYDGPQTLVAIGEARPDGADGIRRREPRVVCPFKGLAFFDRADAEYFCGREGAVSEVVAKLAASTLVGLLGPSGIGKSSLLRAGVLPALSDGALPGSATWRQVLLRPGQRPCNELTRVLGGERLDEALARLEPGDRIVVAVDQLEELFTACESEEERAAFLETLAEAARDHDQRALILGSLRADFYGRFASHRGFAQLLSSSHVLVAPMDRQEFALAIEEPASRAGLEIEQPLVQELVSDVVAEPGGLPLLSTTLLELWEARDGRTLRYESYRSSGGVRGAVARLAERTFLQFDERQQAMARNILLRLVSGEDGAPVRRRMPRSELQQIVGADWVLEALTDARLVTTSDGEVELSHEALVHEWPRYRQWLEEERVGRSLQAHLLRSAREWESSGRDPGGLYRGARLSGALEWAAQHSDLMNPLERDFLDASDRATRQEARRQRFQNRRLRSLLLGVGALLVVAVVAAVIAVAQGQHAQAEATTATSLLLASDAQANLGNQLDVSMLLSLAALDPSNHGNPIARAEARSSMITALEAVQAAGLRAVLRGHTGSVPDVAFSLDGRTLASAGSDGTVRLWDLATHRQLGAPLTAHTGPVYSVAFSPNGRTLASGGADGTVRLWGIATHKQLGAPLTAHTGPVYSVAFSPNGRTLASAGADGTVRLWDLATHGQLGPPLAADTGIYSNVAFSPDGRTLASPGADGTVRLWDLATHKQLGAPLIGHSGPVYSVAFSPDGGTLASGGTDATVRLWDIATHRQLGAPLTGHNNAVNRVAFSPDGRTLASAGDDGTVRLWDIATHKQLGAPLTAQNGAVYGVAFSPDGRTLASGGADATVRLWNLATRQQFGAPLTAHNGVVYSVAFSRDGRTLASPGPPGAVRLWDLATHKQLGPPLTASDGAPVTSVAFSPDGRTLASGGADAAVRLWNLATHRQLGMPLTGHRGPVSSVAFSPDGGTLASASYDETLRLWDIATHKQLGPPLTGHTGQVYRLAFSPDGRTLASGGVDGTVRLWDLATHKQLGSPLTASDAAGVYSVAFSPDGRTLASAADDGTVRFWDLATHKQLGPPLTGHTGPVFSVAFSPDGRTLASGGNDTTVRLWDLATHEQLGPPLTGHTGPVYSVAFSPDRRTLASAGADGTVRLWSLVLWRNYTELRNEVCRLVGSGLSRTEWGKYAPGVPYRQSCP